MEMFIVGISVVVIALGAGGLLQLHWQTRADRRLQHREHSHGVFVDEVVIEGELIVLIEFEPLGDSDRDADAPQVRRVS